jgi:uncharacterized damage-inducible protein DinB
MLADHRTMARYNAWANRRLHAACATLGDEALRRPRKAFFSSIMGTLNHILLVDELYRDRLEKRKTRFTRLDEILHESIVPLSDAQFAEDERYIKIMDSLTDSDLLAPFGFFTIPDNEWFELPLGVCLTNLYQHQIHHRGQAHNMLSQADLDPPPLDFILFSHENHAE